MDTEELELQQDLPVLILPARKTLVGDLLRIEVRCVVRGRFTVTWAKDGVPLNTNRCATEQRVISGATNSFAMSLKPIRASDDGEYRVEVENEAGPVELACTISLAELRLEEQLRVNRPTAPIGPDAQIGIEDDDLPGRINDDDEEDEEVPEVVRRPTVGPPPIITGLLRTRRAAALAIGEHDLKPETATSSRTFISSASRRSPPTNGPPRKIVPPAVCSRPVRSLFVPVAGMSSMLPVAAAREASPPMSELDDCGAAGQLPAQSKSIQRVSGSINPITVAACSPTTTQQVAPQIATIGGSGDVNDSSAEVLSVFECPVCLEYMLPPYLQCHSGHLVCGNCRPKLQCCPTCRGPTPSVRNLGLEKIANTVRFPCKFTTSGCPLFFFHMEKVEHEETCECRPYSCPCPGASCKWQGGLTDVMEHLKKVHKSITTLQGEDIVFLATDINLPGAVDWVMMQSCFGFNFMLVLEKQDREQGQQMFYAVVQLIGAKKDAENFMYRLELSTIRRRLTWEATPRSIHEGVAHAIQQSDCLSFDTSTAQLFAENGNLGINVTISMIGDPINSR